MELTMGKVYFAYWIVLLIFCLLVGKVMLAFISGPYSEDIEYRNYLVPRAMNYEVEEYDGEYNNENF